MSRVACLGIGGGLNHLCEVEVPEVFAEVVGGRLIGVHMWQPTGHDLLGDPQVNAFVGTSQVRVSEMFRVTSLKLRTDQEANVQSVSYCTL